MIAKKEQSMERAVGRRKTAIARTRIMPGKGEITVNGKGLKEFFPLFLLQQKVLSPLKVTGRENDMDVSVKVLGGGVHGQADAVRHGIARALVKWNEDLKPMLKAEGYLTRDSRAKERKKYGRRKARRGHQWKKR
ncbi:MAG: 30S ribosomal protein S9 [Candidatus Magasanikbacteria bacterium]